MKDGDRLWFVLKKKPVEARNFYYLEFGHSIPVAEKQLTDNPNNMQWQFEARYGDFDLNWVTYEEEGVEKYGKAFYFGRVSHATHHETTTASQIERSRKSCEVLATLPKLEIFVDYEGIPRPLFDVAN